MVTNSNFMQYRLGRESETIEGESCSFAREFPDSMLHAVYHLRCTHPRRERCEVSVEKCPVEASMLSKKKRVIE